MNEGTITLELTTEQAIPTMSALHGQRVTLERLRQDMITNLSPQESIRTVEREAKLLEEVGRMIKEELTMEGGTF